MDKPAPGSLLTVGAENKFGNRGDSEYFDGLPVGGAPEAGDEYVVTSTRPVLRASPTPSGSRLAA
ncbi:MAG: hypothetical protein M3452_05220 [Chloroflexota bacterium]|nr:hypothetical protein [Chloroflexota bacterium]